MLLFAKGDVSCEEHIRLARDALPDEYSEICSLQNHLESEEGKAQLHVAAEREELVKNDPKRSIANRNFALAQLRRALGKNAVEDYLRDAIKADPNHVLAHFDLALLLEKRGDAGEAEEHLRAAISTDETFAAAHFRLSELLREKEDDSGAMEHLRRTLSADPTRVEARLNLAGLLMKTGETAEAEKYLREVISADPTHAKAKHMMMTMKFNIAASLMETGEHAEAEKHLRALISAGGERAIKEIAQGEYLQHLPTGDKVMCSRYVCFDPTTPFSFRQTVW